jgi:hypothetical protein
MGRWNCGKCFVICCGLVAILAFWGFWAPADAQEESSSPPATMPGSGLKFPTLFGGLGPDGSGTGSPSLSNEPCPAPYQSPLGCSPQAANGQPWSGWTHRPLGADWFAGVVQGSPLIDDWVGMKQGFIGGVRLDWDPTACCGVETRFAMGSVDLYDGPLARALRATDGNSALPEFDRRQGDLIQWDFDFLYYPWGDRPCRPYVSVGLGVSSVHFADILGETHYRVAPSFPIGLGVKFLWTDWLAFRLDCMDDIAVGGQGIDTLHNFSLTGGAEIRFGGSHHAYWPWNPGRLYW